MSSRNFTIDWLRFIGLMLIVLAHVQAPWLLTQLRSFDVPVMVFISGLCYKPYKGGYLHYIWRRFKRLYFPTFIFLIIFFIAIAFVRIIGIHIPYSLGQVIGSFILLQNPSIGYVWIIRVFILMALIAPVIDLLVSRLKFPWLLFFSIIIFILLNLLAGIDYTPSLLSTIFVDYILYTIGYGLIMVFSFAVKNVKRTTLNFIGVFSSIALGITLVYLGFSKEWIELSPLYKYPPHSYFIIYGLLSCAILYAFPFKFNRLPFIRKCVQYISINSLWIYLWHIPFVVLLNYLDILAPYWYIKWIVSIGGAIGVTHCQILIVDKYSNRLFPSIIKYLK